MYKLKIYSRWKCSFFFYIIVVILVESISSCKKFITVSPPTTQLVTENVFLSISTATAAQVAIYAQMESNVTFSVPEFTGLSSDELMNLSTDPDLSTLYANSLMSTNALTYSIWTAAYQYINEANANIDGVAGSLAAATPIKNQLIGEAKFVRAFWYFYLTNLFGDVPLVTTQNYKTNAKAVRSTQQAVYNQIITDLTDAEQELSANFLDNTDSTMTQERTRPTKWAATALLARVYLFQGDLKDAEAEASMVINNPGFTILHSLDSVFLKNSEEAIWQLQAIIPNYNTFEGGQFIPSSAPMMSVSPFLLNAFENGDQRRIRWIDSSQFGGVTYYYPYKYKIPQNVSGISEYSMVLRLAEQFLIRAEARAKQGNDMSGALHDLNLIRVRAGLPNVSTTNKDSIINLIQHERQVELFTEWGHRWFDIKRSGNVNIIMPPITSVKGGSWASFAQWYPIPLNEINNDPHLSQNDGY